MFGDLGLWLNWIGVAVFALTGALAAGRRGLDPVSFALLAIATGVGGGTLRDLLVGARPVFWVADPTDVLICIAVALVVFAGGGRFPVRAGNGRRRTAIVWADAVGMALFAVTGAERALSFGAPPLAAVALGIMTATFGGIIRDLLAGDPPLVVRSREIYVTAATLAAGTFVILAEGLAIERTFAAMIGIATGFTLRALALVFGWQLPTFQPKAQD